jgi:hypothetical protein
MSRRKMNETMKERRIMRYVSKRARLHRWIARRTLVHLLVAAWLSVRLQSAPAQACACTYLTRPLQRGQRSDSDCPCCSTWASAQSVYTNTSIYQSSWCVVSGGTPLMLRRMDVHYGSTSDCTSVLGCRGPRRSSSFGPASRWTAGAGSEGSRPLRPHRLVIRSVAASSSGGYGHVAHERSEDRRTGQDPDPSRVNRSTGGANQPSSEPSTWYERLRCCHYRPAGRTNRLQASDDSLERARPICVNGVLRNSLLTRPFRFVCLRVVLSPRETAATADGWTNVVTSTGRPTESRGHEGGHPGLRPRKAYSDAPVVIR